MGTRHIIAVVNNGEYKIAQYGQWDGYPSGQGVEVLRFLRLANREAFKAKVAAAHFMTPEEAEAKFRDGGIPEDGRCSLEQGEVFRQKYPEMSRDTGAGILNIVLEREPGIGLQNAIDFCADSLFCEWAYVIDLDTNMLEVYEGFNKEPLPEGARFADMKPEKPNYPGAETYYPVRKVAEFPLDKLPSDMEFVRQLEPQDESA